MKNNGVPLAAALAATVAIAAIVALSLHAGSSRDAQVRLSAATAGLNELQTASRAQRIALEEQALATATDVGGASVVAALQRNFAVLERGGRLTGAAESSRLAAVDALTERSAAYGRDARRAQLGAAATSVIAILVLLGAFSFYYVRSASSRRRERLAYAELDGIRGERKRLLLRAVEAADDERTRIASDLHDGPIQRLTAAAFTIDLLGRKLARGERELDGLLAQIREQLSSEMESLRHLMTGLRPPRLDQGDMTAAIRDCADGLLGPGTTHKVRDAIGNTFVTRELESAAFHVAREAIANVKKHANASHVAVTLSAEGANLRITVIDDGAGFVPESAATARLEHHVGLIAMRERVESLGGELQVMSEPGAGTRIDAVFPLPRPALDLGAERETHAAVA